MTLFFCGFAIVILAIESQTRLEMVQNPRMWTWSITAVATLCATIGYQVWVVDDLDLSVKLANEVLVIEQELKKGMWLVHIYISKSRNKMCVNFTPDGVNLKWKNL